MNLHEMQTADNVALPEKNDSSVTFTNLLDRAEEMMQSLAIQISNYVGYESKPLKAKCIDRGSSPVAVKTRSAKVLCKPYAKSVGNMSVQHQDKVNVSIQVKDDLCHVSVQNRGTSIDKNDLEKTTVCTEIKYEKPSTVNTEDVMVKNELTDEIKTKLIVQQMPSINIPRSLVTQRIPDIVITATESLPETEVLQDNNIGYIIMKHHSTDKVTKSTARDVHPCGCTKQCKNRLNGIEKLPSQDNDESCSNTLVSNVPNVPSILKTTITPTCENRRVSVVSSVVSFDYDKKVYATSNDVENTKDVDYFNQAYKSDDSISEVARTAYDNEDDVFDRSSRLSTYIELGKTDNKLKEYVKGAIKDPKTEIMFKSFQLINDHVEIDVEEGHEVDLSSVDVNFYKTFVNPNGPKNTEVDYTNVSNVSSRYKIRPDDNGVPTAGSGQVIIDEARPQLNKLQKFQTENDFAKPSDSDFSEILVGLTPNSGKNYYNNKIENEPEEGIPDLRQIEEDPILKVRELYQEAVRINKKSGQFLNTHSIDITIPPEIQEKFYTGRTSTGRAETEFKGAEPFTKPQAEKATPRMIDINVNNFLNTMPDNTSIYSDTTEDVILEIDTDQLREAQQQNLNAAVSKGNDLNLNNSEYVITHDISVQTSLEEISQELVTTELSNAENHNNDVQQPVISPTYSYTSEIRGFSSQLNLAMSPRTDRDSPNENVHHRKNVKIEEPNQNKTTKEIGEEESILTFISQLTNSGAMKDPVLAKHFTPSDTQSFFPKYYITPDNAITTEISTQTSNSQTDLPDNILYEGQTQTDIWHAAINQPYLPDLSNSKEMPKIGEGRKSSLKSDDIKNGQYSVHNSEYSTGSGISYLRKRTSRDVEAGSTLSSSPIYTIHTNLNKAWESNSNSEPLTTSDKSAGEVCTKCSASIGEIHDCSSKNTSRRLRKYPQDLIAQEFGKDNMKIRRKKVYNKNWISYYVSRSSNPQILDDTSDSIGLVNRK